MSTSGANDSNCIRVTGLLAGFERTKPICRIEEFSLRRKSITVMCGPNGAGKSTFVKTIARQLHPLAGKIYVDGSNLSQLSSAQTARRLAYVPQFTDSKRSLSVEEWVALGRNPHQNWWSWAESEKDRQKIEEALKRTDCLSFKDKTMDALSGGEQQRVQIATALAQEPAYLLLDEPTAHLDFRHQLELLQLLKLLRDEGLGILLVLHDLNLSARIADQVVMLKKLSEGPSMVTASGTVEEVLTQDTLREVYGVEMEILSNEDQTMRSYVAKSVSNL